MLREIQITNLALIEKLRVSLQNGLTVLTGETGAGKSIFLQAIHLLAGGKAATNWVRTGAETASVEALFEFSSERGALAADLKNMGFDADGEVIIKRVINKTGKSRYYLNGSLANAATVGTVLENLLSVASQHDHQKLLAPRQHLDFIDAVGGLWQKRRQLGELHEQWSELKSRYRQLLEKERDKEQRRDFLAFQSQEIAEAVLQPGEDEELARERDCLKASDDLTRLGQASYQLLNDTVTASLALVRKNLEQMALFDKNLTEMSQAVAEYSYQLEESLFQLRRYLDTIPNDPGRLETVNERIDSLQRLKRKYGISLEEVIAFGEKAEQELAELDAMDEHLAELEQQVAGIEEELVRKSRDLSAARRKVAANLARKVHGELVSLCFEQACFEIHFNEAGRDIAHLARVGWDRPEFMFSANPGEPVKPVAKIASGGELSRLMLALKCIFARKDQVETVIFDEIDAGISGKAAEAVARKIKELAGHHQVLCISHLPQIASAADDHFTVRKTVTAKRTQTTIMHLAPAARVQELARMLAGDSVTEKTLAYAQELIVRNQ